MLQLSNTTDTRIAVKFAVINLNATGFTANVKINGKDYALSPVMDGALAAATVPVADAQAIPSARFVAQVSVLDADGKDYQVSGWQGIKVGYAIDGLIADNLMYISIQPPITIPDDGGGGGGTVKSVNGETPDSSGNVELDVQAEARYDQETIPAADISTSITLSSETANIYDLSQETGSISITMPTEPAASDDKVADVALRIDTGATLPSITFMPTTDVFCPMDGDDNWGTLTASAMNFYSFTSMGTDGNGNRVWMVGHYAKAFPTQP